ncbi:MAG: nicotinate-nucleotide--dimethylbenzimidazole phosphoribosyltransferase [Lachnospiraceae bacterium]|nr:nicotinate-nucleotide--dimethylbenzimidazole phosphoribosyltransferase [Lachnospiraceae bacterium]
MTTEELFSLRIRVPAEDVRQQARKQWDAVMKPIDGLGDFEKMICRIAAVRGTTDPDITRKALIIMCADNGVVVHGVSQTDAHVTNDVAVMMGQRKSSAGIMAGAFPVEILTVDVGIASDRTPAGVIDRKVRKGTADLLTEPAMTAEECLQAIETGIEMARLCSEKGIGLIATGEMGIGNTTTSAALVCATTGASPAEVVGRGAGLSDEGLRTKLSVVEDALAFHFGARHAGCADSPDGAFEALRRVGGLDIAGLAGVFIGGATLGIPVVIDGLISAAAALCAERMVPGCRASMIASHSGRERGTAAVLRELGLRPVIDADLALGEGSGALMLFPLLDMAMSLYRDGTRFDGSGIDPYERFGG